MMRPRRWPAGSGEGMWSEVDIDWPGSTEILREAPEPLAIHVDYFRAAVDRLKARHKYAGHMQPEIGHISGGQLEGDDVVSGRFQRRGHPPVGRGAVAIVTVRQVHGLGRAVEKKFDVFKVLRVA